MAQTPAALPTSEHSTANPAGLDADVLVVATRTEGEGESRRARIAAPALAAKVVKALEEAAAAVGHTGKATSAVRVPAPNGVKARAVVLTGLGALDAEALAAAEPETLEAVRRAAGAALGSLTGLGSAVAAVPGEGADLAEAWTVGALLGAYRYTAYLSEAEGRGPVARLVISAGREAAEAFSRGEVIARATAATRDLVNQPPRDLFPASFAEAVSARAGELKKAKIRVEVLDEAQLAAKGFGGHTGVGQGSPRGPRLVKLSYAPRKAGRHLALVGKGITFDSGGLSLKPAASMEEMKSDMAGAAAAAHALFAIAELGLPLKVTAWLALAENMPSGTAQRPSDVITIYGGKTVEVTNTDAEGRLVLADALVAAQEEKPDLVVDIATLTGAQIVALGNRTSGVMGTESARNTVVLASEASGEQIWPMPIPEELIRSFDSNTADLKNAGGRAGGMLAAGAFLREFVEEGIDWAHLDIAGPSFNSESAHGYTGKGGTGVPVRTLVEVAALLAES
ncbi:leucyl aminopeptidase [Brevibacterium album]|uniref:leucyl aminopeptidase n=1 Tax=Brevibacterium album TaxID=417948 RepID=UPI0003FBFEA7|nr:leucyl aminopeptidase [Brevibacterium album]